MLADYFLQPWCTVGCFIILWILSAELVINGSKTLVRSQCVKCGCQTACIIERLALGYRSYATDLYLEEKVSFFGCQQCEETCKQLQRFDTGGRVGLDVRNRIKCVLKGKKTKGRYRTDRTLAVRFQAGQADNGPAFVIFIHRETVLSHTLSWRSYSLRAVPENCLR